MDFCCGATMAVKIRPLHSERGMLLTDVPFLVCHTCGNTVVAPSVETQVTLYVHHCETDGVTQASLLDAVSEAEIAEILSTYEPFDSETDPYVTEDQVDHMLDVWNFAAEIGDQHWIDEIKNSLHLLHQVKMHELTQFHFASTSSRF